MPKLTPVLTRLFAGAALGLAALTSPAAQAEPLSGDKGVYVLDQEGSRLKIADIRFEPSTGGSRYTLSFQDEKFGDHFLSMRPFKCLEGPEKYWCHVPYPYAIQREVTGEDLTDLEYDLLFLWKGATDYGINMWNGVYYRLQIDGERLTGTLHEMNMDILSAPPAAGDLRPIPDDALHSADADSHWLPRLVIE